MPQFEKLLRNAISLTSPYSDDSEPKTHHLEKQYCLNRYFPIYASHYRTRERDSATVQGLTFEQQYRTGERDSAAKSDLIQALRPARLVQYPLGWTAGEPKATWQPPNYSTSTREDFSGNNYHISPRKMAEITNKFLAKKAKGCH